MGHADRALLAVDPTEICLGADVRITGAITRPCTVVYGRRTSRAVQRFVCVCSRAVFSGMAEPVIQRGQLAVCVLLGACTPLFDFSKLKESVTGICLTWMAEPREKTNKKMHFHFVRLHRRVPLRLAVASPVLHALSRHRSLTPPLSATPNQPQTNSIQRTLNKVTKLLTHVRRESHVSLASFDAGRLS